MTESALVALVRCESYREDEVFPAIKTAMELLGGWQLFLKPEERILLKPNLLKEAPPSAAVTTHPAIVKATALLLREAGFMKLSYGDSPGGDTMESAALAAGIAAAAREIALPAADFRQSSKLAFEGISFTLCKGALEAEALVNLPKMKTHALERITGAVKNLYGCVQGRHKAMGHTRYPDAFRFAAMLAKLEKALKPRLHIMDGITAMEGNGPASGDPVDMKLILASGDPYALDEVFCRLIGLDPALVPTNAFAPSRAVVIRTVQGDISGEEALRLYGKKDFRADKRGNGKSKADPRTPGADAGQKRPAIRKDLCQSCRICVDSCPLSGKALKMQGKYPAFDYQECIRCFCCQEMCPHQAIFPDESESAREKRGAGRS